MSRISFERPESASSIFEKTAALKKDVKLRPHQQQAINNTGDSAIIAHGVGSGKTLTGIAKFEDLKSKGKAKKALVIVPAGLRPNFKEEGVDRFTDSKSNIVGSSTERRQRTYGGIDPNADYNIISYEMFRRNPEKYLRESGADTLIADEGHKTKNEGTQTLNAFKKLYGKYNNYIGLTGSVISNSMADLQPLMDIATQGHNPLGKSKADFENRFVARNDKGPYAGLSTKRQPVTGFKHRDELKKVLGKYVDYMDYDDTKDIAKIPNKHIEVQKVPLSKEQAKLYKFLMNDDPKIRKIIKQKRLETLKDDEVSSAYNALNEARRLMNNPAYLTPKMSVAEGAQKAPKTQKLMDDLQAHLATTKDGQAVLLTNLIKGGADTLESELKRRGIDYGIFLGKQNPGSDEETRQQAVRDYKAGKKKVMVVSGAGAEGLSLGNTTWEGVLDPHYNPERMKQMEARGVRAGGLSHRPPEARTVNINRYLATMPKTLGIFKSNLRTPDEFIYDVAKNKEQQNKMMFDLLKETRKEKLNPPGVGQKIKSKIKPPKAPKVKNISSQDYSDKKPTVIKYGDF